MPVYSNSFKTSSVMIALAAALAVLTNTTLAEEMPMGDFHAKFQEATGKTWESADPQEKRDFVHQAGKTTAETSLKAKAEPQRPDDQSSNLKREITVHARKQFLEANGKPWEEGTVEEQEAFLKEYRKLKNKAARLEEQKKRKEEALERKKERRKKAAREAKDKAQREKEKQKRDEARALEKERKAEKKKLEKRMKELEADRKKMRRKHR